MFSITFYLPINLVYRYSILFIRYTFYYTNEDSCDGGNSYGLIISNKADSPNKDGVIALITDSDISCL